jgi:hypothetical protein
MKKPIVLFLVSMLVACQLAFAQVPTGSMTTYVVGGNDLDQQPVEESDDSGMGMITSYTASQTEPIVDIPDEVEDEAGITPDSPLYGLDRAVEKVSLAFTFGKAAKAKKGLAHARERLVEMQAMMASNMMVSAQIAHNEYQGIMNQVNEGISTLSTSEPEQEFADDIEFEQALYEHEAMVQQIKNVKLQISGILPEQQNQLEMMLASLESSNVRSKLIVKAKKDLAIVRIKAKGLTDAEFTALEAQITSNVQSKISYSKGKNSMDKITGNFKGVSGGKPDDKEQKNNKDKENLEKENKGKAIGKNK